MHQGQPTAIPLRVNWLLIFGSIVVVVGGVTALIGGIGEIGYYQCVASTSAPCTTSGNSQYITVFLANNDLLTVGLNFLLIGVVMTLAGIIANTVKPHTIGAGLVTPIIRHCPKCGVQVAPNAVFCPNCGNKLGP